MPTMMIKRMPVHGMAWMASALLMAGVLALSAPSLHARQSDAPAPEAQPAPVDAHAPASDHAAADAPAADHGAPAAPAADAAHGGTDAHGADAAHGGEGDHGESFLVTLARVANFAILVGVIYWLARKPLAAHLESRGTQIRKDLVDAAQTKKDAAERLQIIEARLASLPAELEQLRVRGVAELEAERARIRGVAEAERDRLVAQARREIAAQTRHARQQLRVDAAALTVDVAADRLRATLTPAEQAALVDDYAARMRNVQ